LGNINIRPAERAWHLAANETSQNYLFLPGFKISSTLIVRHRRDNVRQLRPLEVCYGCQDGKHAIDRAAERKSIGLSDSIPCCPTTDPL
jgi:hypothetical protein